MSSNADSPAGTLTPQTLLAQLTMVHNGLNEPETVTRVRQLSQAERQEFVDARARLGSEITRLQTAQLEALRLQLERQGPALQQGIDELTLSLTRLEGVAAWAGAVNGVLGLLAQIATVAT